MQRDQELHKIEIKYWIIKLGFLGIVLALLCSLTSFYFSREIFVIVSQNQLINKQNMDYLQANQELLEENQHLIESNKSLNKKIKANCQ